MATQTTSIRLPKELNERYSRLAEATRSYYITEAMKDAIDEFEHEAELIKMVEDYRAGRLKTITLEELKESLGLAD
mgnify:CR=1 FL=1